MFFGRNSRYRMFYSVVSCATVDCVAGLGLSRVVHHMSDPFWRCDINTTTTHSHRLTLSGLPHQLKAQFSDTMLALTRCPQNAFHLTVTEKLSK